MRTRRDVEPCSDSAARFPCLTISLVESLAEAEFDIGGVVANFRDDMGANLDPVTVANAVSGKSVGDLVNKLCAGAPAGSAAYGNVMHWCGMAAARLALHQVLYKSQGKITAKAKRRIGRRR